MDEKPLVVHDACQIWLDKLNDTTEEKFQCLLNLEESNTKICSLQEQLKTIHQTSYTLGFNKGRSYTLGFNKGRKAAIAQMKGYLQLIDFPFEGK
jgi:hypothetical protein